MKLHPAQPWILSTGLVLLGALSGSGTQSGANAADELAYRCVAERTLEKRFVQHSEMALVDVQFTIEGPEHPETPEMETPDLKIVDDETIEFSDETLAAGEGKPVKLKRSFTRIDNSVEFKSDEEGAQDEKLENESGLAGKSVLFTWNEEDGAFEATWFEEQGDDALLAPMVEDADFRGWLPGKDVDEGDSWTIPANEYNNLQEPSGPMGYRSPGETDEEAQDPSADELRENVKGEIKATFKGTRDEDGVKVGVIAFEGKVESLSEREVEQEEGPAGQESTAVSSEFEGELLWNLAGGHFHSLSCDSTLKMQSTESQSFEVEAATFTVKQGRSFEGKKTYRFSCSAAKK